MRAPTIAQRLGHTPLIDDNGKPAINVDDPNVLNIARAICENLPADKLFRHAGAYRTIEQSNIKDRYGCYIVDSTEMNPKRLRSWLANFFIFQKGSGEKTKAVKLTGELADTIYWSDTFRAHCPEIDLILPVRLPVWGTPKEDGTRTVNLAAPGYDSTTRTYTADSLDYITNTPIYTPDQLRSAWDKLMYTFPWGSENSAEQNAVWKLGDTIRHGVQPSTNRSACATLALMVGQYARLLINDIMPLGIFNANQPGSGKSLLAWLCITPVWGVVAGSATPKNDEEMIKSLHASLLSQAPYCIMDDIPGINNNTINMIATSTDVSGRILGSLNNFLVRNQMQIIATGNDIFTSPDIERRSLIIDTFMATDAVGRKFDTPLTKSKLYTAAWRADLLRFLYSMVRNWADAGCPQLVEGSAMPSFENYASIVGSILVHNGFLSPFRQRKYTGAGGDLIGRSVLALLAHIVSDVMQDCTTRTFTVSEIVEISNEIHLTETITGGKNPNHSMGKRLEKLRGRQLRDKQGRPFQFGKREESGQSAYTFTLL